MKRIITILLLILPWTILFPQIKFISYNLLNYPGNDTTTRNPYFRTILKSVDPDILVVQEITSQDHLPVIVEFKFDKPVPVELTSFTATVTKNIFVHLSWQTAIELNNQGFEVEKKNGSHGKWFKIGNVEGNGSSIVPHEYFFVDKNLKEPGQYFYRLKQTNFDGSFEYSIETNVSIEQKLQVELIPIHYDVIVNVPYEQHIRLGVYDILGREVELLADQTLPMGIYLYSWNPQSSGIFFYFIQSDLGNVAKKIIFVK